MNDDGWYKQYLTKLVKRDETLAQRLVAEAREAEARKAEAEGELEEGIAYVMESLGVAR